jgi:hypothetical protein
VREHAARVVQRAFLRCYYDVGFALCRRRLMREAAELIAQT